MEHRSTPNSKTSLSDVRDSPNMIDVLWRSLGVVPGRTQSGPFGKLATPTHPAQHATTTHPHRCAHQRRAFVGRHGQVPAITGAARRRQREHGVDAGDLSKGSREMSPGPATLLHEPLLRARLHSGYGVNSRLRRPQGLLDMDIGRSRGFDRAAPPTSIPSPSGPPMRFVPVSSGATPQLIGETAPSHAGDGPSATPLFATGPGSGPPGGGTRCFAERSQFKAACRPRRRRLTPRICFAPSAVALAGVGLDVGPEWWHQDTFRNFT